MAVLSGKAAGDHQFKRSFALTNHPDNENESQNHAGSTKSGKQVIFVKLTDASLEALSKYIRKSKVGFK